MALTAGTRLGPYEVVSGIGAGGMGEVYRARDTRLDRTVAVKILPEALASDPQFRERFDREARAISQLTHPHICTLYDVGEDGGTAFIVMELLDGETLADRLTKGPLPPAQALPLAIQIASALDTAHRAGIIHRDLKPANVMVAKSGAGSTSSPQAKLLDFGLAKAQASVVAVSGTMAPTTPPSVTAQGTILGTFQYMAPEQIEGIEADARTDLFAFGCVLFEMLTGKKAFEGKTRASLIGAILKDEPPPVSQVQPVASAALNHLVARCLAKDPADRWQTARDLMHELQWIADSGSQATVAPAPVVVRHRSRERLIWASLAAVLLLTTVMLAALYLRQPPADARPLRFVVATPEGTTLARTAANGASAGPLAVSPDGRRVAFVTSAADGKRLLYIRALDALTPQLLAGTDGVLSPFWSPDSRFLAFFADGKLKKIDISGGPPATLCDAATPYGGTWSGEGVIVFSMGRTLQKVAASGGIPATIREVGKDETNYYRPSFLPDGRHYLYRAVPPIMGGSIYAGALDSSDRAKVLTSDSTNVLYSQGHLLFLRQTTLMAQAFDARRLAVAGEPFPVAEQIQTVATTPSAVFSVSDSGVLAYQTGTASNDPYLGWLDRSGKQIGTVGEPGRYGDLELSPDGQRAAVSITPEGANSTGDIWLFDVARGLRTRFTFDPADEFGGVWSPDGSRIVFNSRRSGHLDLYQKASSGGGTEDVLLADAVDKYPLSWSPDGRHVMYATAAKGTTGPFDLWVLPLFGDRKPFAFLRTSFNEVPAMFSPDGRWVAYMSNESGRPEIYVAPFPGPGGKWQVSTSGGAAPRWRRDGKEIYFLNAPSRKLMAAAVNGAGSTFQVGAVEPLFTVSPSGPRSVYDVSSDGQRFLVIASPEQRTTAPPPVTIVVNWTAGRR